MWKYLLGTVCTVIVTLLECMEISNAVPGCEVKYLLRLLGVTTYGLLVPTIVAYMLGYLCVGLSYLVTTSFET